MNSSRAFTRSAHKTFRKPLDFLSNFSSSTSGPSQEARKKRDSVSVPRRNPRRTTSVSSLDDTDHSDVEFYAQMEARRSHSAHNSQSELQPPMPLIDIGSRSASPSYPRNRSAAQSEDEDDEYGPVSSIRPLVGSDVGRGSQAYRGFWRQGGPGTFFFSTRTGWSVWVGLLVFWVGGCSFGLLLMNRFIMLTGIYKFPFPLTLTFVQFLITHLLLLLASSLLRFLSRFLRFIAFDAAIPPSQPAAPRGGAYRGGPRKQGVAAFMSWLSNGSGGIAGGGLFEFDWQIAKQVLPLAVIFVVKVLLSNFSFAYAPLNTYQLARIGIVPLAIIFACFLQTENLNGSVLSSALIATLNLFFASWRTDVRVTWESVVAGVFSSLFVAVYPILLLRTYKLLVAGLVPQGDVLSGYPTSEDTGNREETRAFFRLLHYLSLLSIILLTPIVLVSGQIPHIYHNMYVILDVPFFWLMMLFGGMGSWAVLSGTLLLVKDTSPLTTTFVAIPRSAFQLFAINILRGLPAPSWVGVILCWLSSIWFVFARREESKGRDRLRFEGR